MGTNPWTAPLVMVFVVLQTAAAAACGFYDVPWWAVFVLSYAVSAFGAGNLMAAHHEITHFLVFKRPAANRVFAVLANCPLGVPLGSLFKQYHVDHHSDMVSQGLGAGEDGRAQGGAGAGGQGRARGGGGHAAASEVSGCAAAAPRRQRRPSLVAPPCQPALAVPHRPALAPPPPLAGRRRHRHGHLDWD